MVFLLKIGLATVVLAWLISNDRLQISRLASIRLGWPFAGLVALIFGSMVLPAVRWWWLLRIQKIISPLPKILRLTWVGYIAALVLPGAASGDLARSIMIVRDHGDARARAFSTVLADRFLGLYSLFVLGLTSLLTIMIYGGLHSVSPMLQAGVICPFLAMSLLAVALYLRSSRELILRSFPAHWKQSCIASIDCYQQNKVAVLGCMCVSLLSSGMTFASFAASSHVLECPVPWTRSFMNGPLIVLSNCLPITPGGAGIAEAISSELFSKQGFSNGAEVVLLPRICGAILSIPGMFVLFFSYRNTGDTSKTQRKDSLK